MNILKLLIILSLILQISLIRKPEKDDYLTTFHILIKGEDSVKSFSRTFPFIVSDDVVYLAYLEQNYYNNKLIKLLIHYDYYKRTMSKSN